MPISEKEKQHLEKLHADLTGNKPFPAERIERGANQKLLVRELTALNVSRILATRGPAGLISFYADGKELFQHILNFAKEKKLSLIDTLTLTDFNTVILAQEALMEEVRAEEAENNASGAANEAAV